MKTLCQISGTTISASNTFTAQIKSAKLRTRTLARHPVFSYSLRELVILSAEKEPQQWTPEQRHLLFLALAHKTGTLVQEYPILPGSCGLTEYKLLSALPAIILLCSRIVLNREGWKDLQELEALPSIVVRADQEAIDLPAFYSKTIAPFTELLALGKAGTRVTETRDPDSILDRELFYERELKRALSMPTKSKSNIHKYSPTIGKHVLKVLCNELGTKVAIHDLLPMDYYQQYQALLISKPSDTGHIPEAVINRLWEHLNNTVKISVAPEDTIIRAYVSLTLQHVKECIEYKTDLNAMFGCTTTLVSAQLNPAIPANWRIRTLAQDPLSAGTLTLPAVAPNTTNPLALRLRAERLAKEEAAKVAALAVTQEAVQADSERGVL